MNALKWLLRISLGVVLATIQLYRQQDDVTHNNLGNSITVVVLGSIVAMGLVFLFRRVTGQDRDD